MSIINTGTAPTTLNIRLYASTGTATDQSRPLGTFGEVSATSQLTIMGFVGMGANNTVFLSHASFYSSTLETSSGKLQVAGGYGTAGVGQSYTGTWTLVISQNGINTATGAGSLLWSWNVQRMRA